MANTLPLKGNEETPLEGSSPSSGIALRELIKAHEALLNTLHASNHYWIKMVYRSAAAYYKTWKKEYESQSNEENS